MFLSLTVFSLCFIFLFHWNLCLTFPWCSSQQGLCRRQQTRAARGLKLAFNNSRIYIQTSLTPGIYNIIIIIQSSLYSILQKGQTKRREIHFNPFSTAILFTRSEKQILAMRKSWISSYFFTVRANKFAKWKMGLNEIRNSLQPVDEVAGRLGPHSFYFHVSNSVDLISHFFSLQTSESDLCKPLTEYLQPYKH